MDKIQIGESLQSNYAKQHILYLREQALKEIIKIKDILELCYDENAVIAFRAAWLLEHITVEYPHLIHNVVKGFLEKYHLQQNESAQRCFSKIAMIVLQKAELYKVSYKHFEHCLTASFDWLINDRTPVAIKCNCIDVIYGLSHHEGWILEELKPILEKNLLSESPALLSRTKRILKEIGKQKQNGNR